MEQEVVSIWAGTNGHLDDVPVDDVSRFESEFIDSLKRNNAGILDSIRETRDLTDDTAAALKDAIEQFRRTFEKSNGELLVTDEDEPEAMGEDEAGHEKVTRYTGPDGGEDGQSGGEAGGNSSPSAGASDVNGPSGGASAAAQPAGGNTPGGEPGSGD
jgi:hypothetical protein